MSQPKPAKPGFVRVLITARNKTICVRESHARNPAYLAKYGMSLIPAPLPPPVPMMPPVPTEIPQPQPKAKTNGK